MHSPNVLNAPRTIVVAIGLAFALSTLSACSDYSPTPTAPDGPPLPPGPTPSTVDVAYCRGGGPSWVAFQDGDGTWTRVQPTTSGAFTTFHCDFTSDRGAIARASQFASGLTSLSIHYGLPFELAVLSDTAFQQCSDDALKTLNGTVAGLDTNEVALVSTGNSVRDFTTPELGNTWQLRGLLAGPQEFLVTRARLVNGAAPVTGMILRRIPALPDGATLPAFDFASPEAFQPLERTVSFAGLGSDVVTTYTALRTAHSNNIVTIVTGVATNTARPYIAIPEDRLAPGELQSVGASSFPTANVVRGAALYFRSPVDRTLTFGAVPNAPALSVVASAPTARLRARFAAMADYDRLTSINFQQGQNTVVTLSMTQAYADLSTGGYDLVVPDLTGVPGFDQRWALHSGASVIWTSSRIGGTLGWDFYAVPREGDTRRYVTDAGFITP